MVKSPEEHFNNQDFSPVADSGEYTPAERLFMIKYLGIEVGKSGALEPPSPPDPSDNLDEVKPNAAAVIVDAMSDLEDQEGGKLASAESMDESAVSDDAMAEEVVVTQIEKNDLQDEAELQAAEAMEAQASFGSSSEPAPIAGPEPLSESMPEAEAAAPMAEGVAGDFEKTISDSATESSAKSSEPPARTLTAEEQARKDFADAMLKDPALEVVLKDEEYVQMVGFYIGDQEFVVPTMAMQEVIRYEAPIRIPLAPDFVEGVISLRGRVTPVVNLRDMLVVRNAPLEGDYCIIICLRRGMQLGFLVEKIHTLYRVPQKNLEWGVESHLGINSDVDFISAIMKSEDGTRLLGMLSVDKIIEFILR